MVECGREPTFDWVLTDAIFSILTGNESFVADAVVSIVGVDALAVLADALLLALVRFATFIGFLVTFLTGRAITSEGADGVDARASFAQRRNGLALVNILLIKNTEKLGIKKKSQVFDKAIASLPTHCPL